MSSLLWRAAAAGVLLLHCARAVCLLDGFQPASREGLTSPSSGEEVPVGFWVMNWDSATLASYVVKILVEEQLGLTATFSGQGTSSASGLYATAGCLQPNDFEQDPQCSARQTFTHHIALEIWGTSEINNMQRRLAGFPDTIPEDAGDIGYDGIEGTYVYAGQKQQAYQTEGLPLEYYRSYDAAWQRPWLYFDSYESFDLADLKPCQETRMMDSVQAQSYLNVTGDSAGVVRHPDGTYTARCWNQSWWFSPACRNQPETCVPSVTGHTGWFLYDMMQRAGKFNMPVAVAVAINNDVYRSLARQHNCTPYWWQPDSSFIDLQPTMIAFPAFNAAERAQNVLTSMSDKSRLSKWMHRQLSAAAPRLRELVRRVSIPANSMNEMLLQNKLRNGNVHEEVACEWLQGHRSTWVSWIPIKTECEPGMGLVAENNSFVMNRQDARACTWCNEGRHSVALNDASGSTYICLACAVGRSQASPGSMECEECATGRFTTEPRSEVCSSCAVGAFQNNTGASGCSLCPSPMTTRVNGAAASDECICPEGTYLPVAPFGGDPCAPCPAGMSCALGSAEVHIPPCQGTQTTGGVHPQPLPRFYATCAEPLSAYLCLNEASCPGLRSEACGPGVEGLACGRCAAGSYRVASGSCFPCQGLIPRGVFLLLLVCCVGPLLCWILCKFSNVPMHLWGSPTNTIKAAVYLALIYLQLLAVLQMCYISLPARLSTPIEWTMALLDMLVPVRPECLGVTDFIWSFLLRLCMPLYTLVDFSCTWLILRVIHKALCLTRAPNLLVKVFYVNGQAVAASYWSLYSAFFVGIAHQSFSLLMCYDHPNGRTSLRASPDVLCSSGTWKALLLPAVLAAFVFCICPLTLFGWVNVQAPRLFPQDSFRQRWCFLFMKFRPTVWWWNMVLLTGGVWVGVTNVLFRNPSLQLFWLAAGHMLYFVPCFALVPWRSLALSALDLTVHSMLILVLSLLPHFGRTSGDSQTRTVAVLGVLCLVLPLAGTIGVALAQLRLRFKPKTTVQWQEKAEELARVFCKILDAENAALVLEVLPTADLLVLDVAQRVLQAEMMSSTPSEGKKSKRLSMWHDTEPVEPQPSGPRRGSLESAGSQGQTRSWVLRAMRRNSAESGSWSMSAIAAITRRRGSAGSATSVVSWVAGSAILRALRGDGAPVVETLSGASSWLLRSLRDIGPRRPRSQARTVFTTA